MILYHLIRRYAEQASSGRTSINSWLRISSSASWTLGALSNKESTRRAAWTLARPHADGPPAVYWLVPPCEKTSMGGSWMVLGELVPFAGWYRREGVSGSW